MDPLFLIRTLHLLAPMSLTGGEAGKYSDFPPTCARHAGRNILLHSTGACRRRVSCVTSTGIGCRARPACLQIIMKRCWDVYTRKNSGCYGGLASYA